MSKINLEEYLRFEIYKYDEGKEIIEWMATNEISKDELIDILEADGLYFKIEDKINSIIEEKYAADYNFYMECMERKIYNTPYLFLLETMFENWSIENQCRFIVRLSYQIKYNAVSLLDIPNFLVHDYDILIAVTYDFWDRDSKEQDFFKNCVREANYSKDWEFIEEVFESDDGSIASIIADESIQELPQYWHREFKAWYEYPKESNPEPVDYKCIYDRLPKKFKNDLGFNIQLLNDVIGFYHSFNENMKVNAEICKLVLEKNGLFLSFMPDTIKDNSDLAFIAIKQNAAAIEMISDNLTYEQAFLKKAIDANPDAINYAIPRVKYLYENAE